jgi:hypothetical protein
LIVLSGWMIAKNLVVGPMPIFSDQVSPDWRRGRGRPRLRF